MVKRLMVFCLVLLAVAALSVTAFAGANSHGKIAIHVKAHPTSCTKGYPTFLNCSSIATTWAGSGNVDVLPIFYDLTQYTVVEAGLLWPEADWGTASWVRCKGDVAVGSIIHSADHPEYTEEKTNGVAVAWSACQTGWGVAPGFAWLAVSVQGHVCPAPNPATGDYGFDDCSPSPGPYHDHPIYHACAGIAGIVGDDPCGFVTSDPSTWGKIKSVFR